MGKNSVIMITGGGSWGHRYIISEVKEQLSDERVVYVGSANGQDKEWFDKDRDFFRSYFLNTSEESDKSFFQQITSFFSLWYAKREAIKIIEELNPKVVFCVGGYSAVPMAYAAKKMNIPLVIYEQNAYVEEINRELRSYAKYFISPYLNDSPVSTYPVKKDFFIKQRQRTEIKCLFFLGSAKGSSVMTDLALSLAKELDKRGIKIIHQTGEEHLEEVKKQFEALGVAAKLFGYREKISSFMNEADLAIARAGSSTIWELSANGLPALYIPYPKAPNDHQYHNAKFLVDQKLGWVMREDEIDKEKILSILDEDISLMSTKLISRIEKNGAEKIAMVLKELL